jgi:hypothetical protein
MKGEEENRAMAMTASINKSVRLPDRLCREIEALRGDMNFTEVVTEALVAWLEHRRRVGWGDTIERALKSRSAEQVAAESQLAKAGSKSGRRVLGEDNGPRSSPR